MFVIMNQFFSEKLAFFIFIFKRRVMFVWVFKDVLEETQQRQSRSDPDVTLVSGGF
jgi:hypothetical protein